VTPTPGRLPISAVVVAGNEADRIGRCVASLAALCHETIVLDSCSTDDTAAIASAAGARVQQQPWLGYAAQKNAAIALATQPWVLLLDADEWLDDTAGPALRALFASGGVERADVWRLPRRTHFLGHRLRAGSFAREPVERLFRARFRHAPRAVHEYLDTTGARVATSGIVMEHDTARSEAEYWRKLEGYARLWAEEQRARGRSAWRGRGALAAAAYFIKNLLLRGGVVDGRGGWRFHRLHMRYAALKYRLLASSQERGSFSGR
jgi:(heptosyl)LPS beta-1,4-glucosyltransferase